MSSLSNSVSITSTPNLPPSTQGSRFNQVALNKDMVRTAQKTNGVWSSISSAFADFANYISRAWQKFLIAIHWVNPPSSEEQAIPQDSSQKYKQALSQAPKKRPLTEYDSDEIYRIMEGFKGEGDNYSLVKIREQLTKDARRMFTCINGKRCISSEALENVTIGNFLNDKQRMQYLSTTQQGVSGCLLKSVQNTCRQEIEKITGESVEIFAGATPWSEEQKWIFNFLNEYHDNPSIRLPVFNYLYGKAPEFFQRAHVEHFMKQMYEKSEIPELSKLKQCNLEVLVPYFYQLAKEGHFEQGEIPLQIFSEKAHELINDPLTIRIHGVCSEEERTITFSLDIRIVHGVSLDCLAKGKGTVQFDFGPKNNQSDPTIRIGWELEVIK